MSTRKGVRLRSVLLASVAVIALGATVSVLVADRYFKRLHCTVGDGSVDEVCLRRN